MSTLRDQVTNFHLAMNMPILDRPTVPGDEHVRLRARLILEEAMETVESMFDIKGFQNDLSWLDIKQGVEKFITNSKVSVDLAEVADGLADLDYVIEGSRLEFGIDGAPIAAAVHEANMKKVSGEKRADGKKLKPPGWKPPDINLELIVQTRQAKARDALYEPKVPWVIE